MKFNRSFRSFLLLCALVLSLGALGVAGTAQAEPEPAPAEAAQPAEYVQFVIDHADSAKGLVNGSFGKFTVKKAVVDFEDVSKASAEIEVDISSIDTKTPPRDEHLRSADFFNVAKFGVATISVKGVKAVEGKEDTYSATATVSLHGISKDLPVTFEVVEEADDGSVTIEGSHEFSRLDFGVGGEPAKSGAAEKVVVKLRLKLKNT